MEPPRPLMIANWILRHIYKICFSIKYPKFFLNIQYGYHADVKSVEKVLEKFAQKSYEENKLTNMSKSEKCVISVSLRRQEDR
jgi:hypothetical protein